MKNSAKHLILLALIMSTTAFAQGMYQYKDASGRNVYSDQPPPSEKGVKTLDRAPSAQAPAKTGSDKTPAAASKPAAPKSLAEREMESKKKNKEVADAEEKAEKDRQQASQQKEACEQNKNYLQTLESGERISRTNAQGEKSFLDDDARVKEIAKTKKSITEVCK